MTSSESPALQRPQHLRFRQLRIRYLGKEVDGAISSSVWSLFVVDASGGSLIQTTPKQFCLFSSSSFDWMGLGK
jgi:hypothetical protein